MINGILLNKEICRNSKFIDDWVSFGCLVNSMGTWYLPIFTSWTQSYSTRTFLIIRYQSGNFIILYIQEMAPHLKYLLKKYLPGALAALFLIAHSLPRKWYRAGPPISAAVSSSNYSAKPCNHPWATDYGGIGDSTEYWWIHCRIRCLCLLYSLLKILEWDFDARQWSGKNTPARYLSIRGMIPDQL